MERIYGNIRILIQPIIKQLNANNIIVDVDKDNKDIIVSKIKEFNKKEFQTIKTLEDGNCMTREILKSIGKNEVNHLELRQIRFTKNKF